MRLALFASLLVACAPNEGGLPPLPEFVDDCGEALNDAPSAPAGIVAVDEERASGVRLCEGDVDYYRIDVPPGSWLSAEVIIDGNGRAGTDLDLYEVDTAGEPVWASATEEPYERLAWYNPGTDPLSKVLRVEGFEGAAADYDLLVRTTPFHEGIDCDAFYPDEPAGPSGACNQILQFPAAEDEAAGYFVEHEPHYSNLRREVIYLVRYASEATMAAFPDTKPLAVMDMSERDGSTPGAMVGQLRHPEGTHVDGNDIDIAYYQTGEDNGGRPVCNNDGYFCTGPANRMDARRTAYFLAKLFESPDVRVIGVDPAVAEALEPAADALVDEGLLTAQQAAKVTGAKLAYGDGWPFHHHHLHLSWRWEGGTALRASPPPDGCLVETR